LRQVLTHLLKNAIEFSPPGGTLTIEAGAAPDEALVQVSISDTGIGMSNDQIASLFTMFHQVDSSSRRAHEGVGLGLYICKRLIDAHGGQIWVRSEPERGSTFSFTLPRAAAQPQAEPAPAGRATGD
jgi:signal transduction histidine kinase